VIVYLHVTSQSKVRHAKAITDWADTTGAERKNDGSLTKTAALSLQAQL